MAKKYTSGGLPYDDQTATDRATLSESDAGAIDARIREKDGALTDAISGVRDDLTDTQDDVLELKNHYAPGIQIGLDTDGTPYMIGAYEPHREPEYHALHIDTDGTPYVVIGV